MANELGAGNWKGAKFATKVAVAESTVIGSFFCVLVMVLKDKIAYIFTTSSDVLEAVDDLSYLLAITILLNSVQPVLSGSVFTLLLLFESHFPITFMTVSLTEVLPNSVRLSVNMIQIVFFTCYMRAKDSRRYYCVVK